jgi:lysophospholipase L1-like esterase
MAVPKQPLDILCFGDSLTEGYSQYGLRFTPYSTTLSQRLKEALEQHYEIEVHTDGESGELVTAGFLRRMQQHCTPPFLSLPPFPESTKHQ